MSKVVLILVGMLVGDLCWWFSSDRLLRKGPGWVRILNSIFLGALFAGLTSIVAGRAMGRRFEFPPFPLANIYLWHLFILPMVLLCAPVALLFWGIAALTRWNRKRHHFSPAAAPSLEESSQTRRQFLGTVAAVTPPLVSLVLSSYSQRQIAHFRINALTVIIPNLPPDLHGLSIAHVSDLHAGPFTSERISQKIATEINALRADVVVLTGDLINGKLTEIPEGVAFAKSLESKGGIYLIEGNHDLFEGRAAFHEAVRGAGLNLLINEDQTINLRGHPVQVLGLRWGGPAGNAYTSGDQEIRASMHELLQRRQANDAFPILLAHHPHAFDPAAAAGLPLTLAGHTHGGQLMLNPRVGAGPLLFRYWSGLYRRNNSQLVVSNGVGNWFPLRIAAPAEIVRITLQRA